MSNIFKHYESSADRIFDIEIPDVVDNSFSSDMFVNSSIDTYLEANSSARRMIKLADLVNFEIVAADGSTLIHKATRDLWALELGEDGQYYVKRLFDDTNPVDA